MEIPGGTPWRLAARHGLAMSPAPYWQYIGPGPNYTYYPQPPLVPAVRTAPPPPPPPSPGDLVWVEMGGAQGISSFASDDAAWIPVTGAVVALEAVRGDAKGAGLMPPGHLRFQADARANSYLGRLATSPDADSLEGHLIRAGITVGAARIPLWTGFTTTASVRLVDNANARVSITATDLLPRMHRVGIGSLDRGAGPISALVEFLVQGVGLGQYALDIADSARRHSVITGYGGTVLGLIDELTRTEGPFANRFCGADGRFTWRPRWWLAHIGDGPADAARQNRLHFTDTATAPPGTLGATWSSADIEVDDYTTVNIVRVEDSSSTDTPLNAAHRRDASSARRRGPLEQTHRGRYTARSQMEADALAILRAYSGDRRGISAISVTPVHIDDTLVALAALELGDIVSATSRVPGTDETHTAQYHVRRIQWRVTASPQGTSLAAALDVAPASYILDQPSYSL